ncbi:hypothetical protein [Pseudonocardia spinosispora]|uniref:hypothetical protein n=1 Tax=Pseudonocardia spinosispora TaxID=103441 RepID=UPI00041334D7|nr:hypothetical protein [Pseudonocardia spinosispora]
MLFLIALAAAALVGVLLWKLLARQPSDPANRSTSARPTAAPDDDPEFLRQLGEKLRREGEDPPRRR